MAFLAVFGERRIEHGFLGERVALSACLRPARSIVPARAKAFSI
jgi:hypothetical protein